jgi:uncharacterized spore protein YtfJ
MALAEILKTALDQMKVIAQTETVVGEPIVAGEVTIIPVSRVSIGFAAGGAGKEEKSGNGAGAGGGINITPLAFIVVTGDKVQVQPLTPTDPVLQKVLSLAPDVITNVSKYFKKRTKKEKGEKEVADDQPNNG